MPDQATEQYYPFAFFSAFTTLPSFQPSAKFFTQEIAKLFSDYREALTYIQAKAHSEMGQATQKGNRFLYNPIPYCLFGDFDMAVFSLIDDISFATGKFKPSIQSPGYKYQVNTGIIPLIEAYKTAPQMPKFRDKRLPNFFLKEELYPFTGIATLKLNNAMLVGTGQRFIDLVNFFLIIFLDERIEKFQKSGHRMIFVLNENLGWNEITIYFFGSSLASMQDLVLGFRQMRLRDMHDKLTSLLQDERYDRAKIRDRILPTFSTIKENSLLAYFISKNSEKDYLESHPVIATSTSYGFHIDLISLNHDAAALKKHFHLNNREYSAFSHEFEKNRSIHVGWNIKPGHERNADKFVAKVFPKFGGSVLDQTRTGKYTFAFPAEAITLKDYMDFSSRIEEPMTSNLAPKDIIKIRSRIQWDSSIEFDTFDDRFHYEYHLSDYQIPKETIREVQNQLRIYPIPQIYKGQIENLMINYNDAMTDPLMYNYFIGLKKPLLSFLRDNFLVKEKSERDEEAKKKYSYEDMKAAEPKEKDLPLKIPDEEKGLIESVNPVTISTFIQAWNKAYWNRYFHSYYFTEINDFNIEHHGGIQQILFTYDTIYKLICRRVYGDNAYVPFVNVQVNHYITSSHYYNTINFTHLFRPAIYACECVHEAANHVIAYLVFFKQLGDYKILLNPKTDKIENKVAEKLFDFEEKLYKGAAPRDKYESDYLKENFGINVIRQLVADYCTYKLGYADLRKMNERVGQKKKDLKRQIKFFQTHWFLFLMRADLYSKETRNSGAWFFREEDFKQIFIRFNLMFYLFLDCNLADLNQINAKCPSIELKALWETQKIALLNFTARLGRTLQEQFEKYVPGGFERFKQKIQEVIFQENWAKLGSEQSYYREIIQHNQELIDFFYEIFCESEDEHNIIIRTSKNSFIDENSEGPSTNVEFYKTRNNRHVFLDPRGNLFTTSEESRKTIFLKNISYLKKMWDLSLRIALKDYQW